MRQETAMMAADATKPPLQTIGNYDLLEKVADGGMGSVYRARDRVSGQTVAVKLVAAHMANNPVYLKRFEKEFNAARRLDHPNVVRALDFGTAEGRPYLVMEFVEGESLGQRLDREGRLPEAEAIRITAQVAQGLHKAHKAGLIHRDVKPDNILLTPDGQAKVTDMGLVKETDADVNLTRTGRGLGTPHFMAPEQFRNAKNADARCDVYSLGATLYMMVTGQMPFHALAPLDAWMKKVQNDLAPPRELAPDLSERVDAVIRRAMDPDPAQRPASCREFVEELTGQNTRKASSSAAAASPEVWYLFYKDEEGTPHMVKGSVAAIRRSLKEGLLGDASNVRASRTKNGTFEPLRQVAAFRDLVPAPKTRPRLPAAPTPLPANAPAADGTLTPAPPAVPHLRLKPDAPPAWRGRLVLLLKVLAFIALAIASGILASYFLKH